MKEIHEAMRGVLKYAPDRGGGGGRKEKERENDLSGDEDGI